MTSKMNKLKYESNIIDILFFIHNMSRGAGSERVTAEIANGLAEHGKRVAILSICGNNTSFYPLNKKICLKTLIDKNDVNNRSSFIEVVKNIKNFIREHKVITWIDIFPSLTIYSALFKRYGGYKIVTWDHTCFENKAGMLTVGRWIAAQTSNLIVTLTESDKNSYLSKFKIENKVKVISNPSPYQNESFTEYQSREKKIIAVGRLDPIKRFDLLLSVWSQVEDRNTEWSLEIIGEGAEKYSLKKLAEQLKLRRCSFSGQVVDMARIYNSASLLASTSEREGMPMVMIEALSFGIPVITFDYKNGPRDIVKNGLNGLIALGDSIEKQIDLMANQLEFLMNNDEVRFALHRGAVASSSLYAKDEIVSIWEKTLNTL